MAQILLKAWTNDEYLDPQASFALVEISPRFAAAIVERMERAAEIRQAEDDFYCTEYWNCAPDWVDYDETLEELLGESELVLLEEKPEINEQKLVGQEATRMLVRRDEVYWHSYVKHTSVTMDTASIPRKVLRVLARGGDRGSNVRSGEEAQQDEILPRHTPE